MIGLYGIFIYIMVFWSLCGVSDGLYYSRRGAESFDWDEHAFLMLVRGWFIMYGPMFYFLVSGWLEMLVLVVSSILVFPFYHNGFYYLSRNKIDPRVYEKGFWDEPSKTSTSKINFSLKQRVILFVAGIIIFVITNIFV